MRDNVEALVGYIKKTYKYDPRQGVVINRKRNRVVHGNRHQRNYWKISLWIDGQKTFIWMHQLVWVLCRDEWPEQIDHINGNAQDNRIENLRMVTSIENAQNRMRPWKPNNKSGLPGVFRCNDNKFRIQLNKYLFFRDRYEAFFYMILLGRMFKD